MTVNLGLQLSTAPSHLLVFPHSSQCSPCLFLCFLTWFTSQSMGLQSSHPKISPWTGKRGIFDDEYWKTSRLCGYRPCTSHLNLYSGQSAFRRRGKREGGLCFFPIMHQHRDPNWHRRLARFSRDKHPVSRLIPCKWNLPEASIHQNRHAGCQLKHYQRCENPTHQCLPQLTCHHGQWRHLFYFSCSTMVAKPDVPMPLWHSGGHSWCPEKGLEKQLLADEKLMQCCHIFEFPSLFSFLLTFCMFLGWYNSPMSTVVSDLWKNLNAVRCPQ